MVSEPTPPAAPPPTGPIPTLEVSVVMPCLNEVRTVALCVGRALACLEANGIEGEVIVADNGSTDGSQEAARHAGARVVDVEVRGYGAAVFGGIAVSRGRFVITGDADASYDFAMLMPFVARLRAGDDLVVGNRFAGGIRSGAMPWKNRYIGNPLLSGIGRRLFRVRIRDFHCGLRGFTRDAFERMDLRTTGMEFASEMILKASLLGMRLGEVPTTLSPDGRGRAPHLRPWRDAWRHVRFMLMYSPRWLFLVPGMGLLLAGTGTGAWLLPGPRAVGGIVFDVHTLFFAAVAVLVGYQAVLFWVLGKIFAVTEGLLPPDQRLERLFRCVTLETGLAVGVALVIGGAAGSLWSLVAWGRTSFGPQVPAALLRLVIPSGLALALGCQTVLASFFLSLLGMGRR